MAVRAVVIPLVACLGLSMESAGAVVPQESADVHAPQCGRNKVPSGTVRGRLHDDSTQVPIPSRAVVLQSSDDPIFCTAITDSTGAFVFREVPEGYYKLVVGDLGYRRFHPIPLNVLADSVSEFSLALRPENLVLDCLDVPHCADLLAPPQSSDLSELRGTERLREAVLRTSIALVYSFSDSLPSWTVCVQDSSEVLLDILRERMPNVVHSSRCKLDDTELPYAAQMIDRVTGSPARKFFIEDYSFATADSATANSGYYVGPLHAAGWRCEYKKEPDGWRAVWCGVTWIS